MKKDPNCIFCKIIDQQIPSYKVYEDENFYGFLTIKPHTKGHTLIIPKEHHEDILTLPENLNKELFTVAQNFSNKLKNIFNSKRVAYMVAGLEVDHMHLHLFPLNNLETLNTSAAYDATKEELLEVQKLLTH
jgi:histidine triad (HIT) family protein